MIVQYKSPTASMPIPVTTSSPLPVTNTPVTSATGTQTSVNDTASSTALLAANSSRKGVTIVNDSTATLYVKFGETASATSYGVKLLAGDTYESPAGWNYTGRIDGIWASDASGAARITEFS